MSKLIFPFREIKEVARKLSPFSKKSRCVSFYQLLGSIVCLYVTSSGSETPQAIRGPSQAIWVTCDQVCGCACVCACMCTWNGGLSCSVYCSYSTYHCNNSEFVVRIIAQHARTHARTHACTHARARTHTHTHTHTHIKYVKYDEEASRSLQHMNLHMKTGNRKQTRNKQYGKYFRVQSVFTRHGFFLPLWNLIPTIST